MTGKFALVIGNTEYNDPGLAQLTAPGKDTEDFARILRNRDICAFDEVKVLLNEPESVVSEAIDEFFDQKKPDDLLILYFSGHGVRDELGSLYLAVKNTNRYRLRSTAIKSDYIREVMDQSRSRRQVLILDCCNSGAFAQGTKAATGVSIGTATAFEGGYGRVILTASDSTQFAWEGNQVIGETESSLFTHFLVEGLEGEADQDGDGRITVDELYDYAYENVRLATPKQTPSKFSSKQQGEIVLRQITRLEDIKPVALPDELIEATFDARTFVREGAVQELEKILKGKNLGLARSAREALERIESEDDSRRVSQRATQVLEPIRQAELSELQKAREERLAVEKSETERKAQEKTDTELEISEKTGELQSSQLQTHESVVDVVETPVRSTSHRTIFQQPLTLKWVSIVIMSIFVIALGIWGLSSLIVGPNPTGPPGIVATMTSTFESIIQVEEPSPTSRPLTTADYPCTECHQDPSQISVKKTEWNMSRHGTGESFVLAEDSNCAGCHSGGTFSKMIAAGQNYTEVESGDTDPTHQDCNTCHQIHTTYTSEDWALETTEPVTQVVSGLTFDGGSGNLCANCHQARRYMADFVDQADATRFTSTSPRFDPHLSVQGDILLGSGGEGVEGRPGAHYSMVENTCVACHMGEAQVHTFEPQLATCQECHADAENYDINGAMTAVEERLLELEFALLSAGLLTQAEDGTVSVIPGTWNEAQATALWNYGVIHADASRGVHNPNYVNALLDAAFEALGQ